MGCAERPAADRAFARDRQRFNSIGSDAKGNLSLVIYVASIPLAFVHTWISGACWVFVALLWFIPDRRIERVFENTNDDMES